MRDVLVRIFCGMRGIGLGGKGQLDETVVPPVTGQRFTVGSPSPVPRAFVVKSIAEHDP
jgi:hypothetical protein